MAQRTTAQRTTVQHTGGSSPDDAATTALGPHMHVGEHVVWAQAAPRLRLALPALLPLAFGLAVALIGGAAAVLAAAVALGRFPSVTTTGPPWGLAGVAAFFAAIGVVIVTVTARDIAAAGHIVYAVTDRAALIVDTTPGGRVRRFTATDVRDRRRLGDRISFAPQGEEEPFHPAWTFLGVRDRDAANAALDALIRRGE